MRRLSRNRSSSRAFRQPTPFNKAKGWTRKAFSVHQRGFQSILLRLQREGGGNSYFAVDIGMGRSLSENHRCTRELRYHIVRVTSQIIHFSKVLDMNN